ncbi:hypothetical protein GGS20DRAFT_511337 [Poronia punctata]|nr:hypothetical protein GGS20DRAFT_511337 [Poronia punctata]
MSGRGTPTASISSEMSADAETPQDKKPAAPEMYNCPQCSRSFKRPENLKRHQRGHDERKRFVCTRCGKSFSRSDILGRHQAVHVAREGRNDHPHRKRACYECARVRERCSRGESCRRCTAKGLCCLYPEESRFKISMPDTWAAPTSGPEGYESVTVEDTKLSLEPPNTSRDIPMQGYRAPQCEPDNAPAPYRPSSFLPSMFSQWESYPYQPGCEDPSFLQTLNCDPLSTRRDGVQRQSHRKASYDEMSFTTSDSETDRLGRPYGRAQISPLQPVPYPNEAGLGESGPTYEPRDHHAMELGQLLANGGHMTPSPIPTSHNNKGNPETHATDRASLVNHHLAMPPRYDSAARNPLAQSPPGMGPDAKGLYHPHLGQPPTVSASKTGYPRLVNLKDYEVIATTFKEVLAGRDNRGLASSNNKMGAAAAAAAAAATPRTDQHDLLLRLYFEYFSHQANDVGVGLEEKVGGCLDSVYV